MIASLPMYDRPESRAAHDELWSLIREGLVARGIDAPEALDRETPCDEGWGRPDLVLGQICNLPWRARFRDRVTVIGAADYGLPGCAPGEYFSVVVARADDDRPGERLAYNDPLSNSGWDLAQEWARAAGVAIRPTARTGSHRESLRAVVDGRADLAAIDAVTFRALRRWDAEAAQVRVVGRTSAGPGMTFITAGARDPSPYREAVAGAIAALSPEASGILGLRGIVALPLSAYDRPLPPPPVPAAT